MQTFTILIVSHCNLHEFVCTLACLANDIFKLYEMFCICYQKFKPQQNSVRLFVVGTWQQIS